MKVRVRFSSFIFCVCLCCFLKKHLNLNSLLKMYLITTFFKVFGRVGWLMLCLWYVFYMTLFLIIFFPALPTDFLITEYDDRYVRYMNRLLTVILFSQNGRFIYSVYRLSFSIFPGWQAQNNLKCTHYSWTCAERNRTFNQIVVVLQLPLLCIHYKNIRSSEIACSPLVPLNLKSLPSKLKTGHQRRLKQSDILPVY